MDANTFNLPQQIMMWASSITLPALVVCVWKVSRWATKKEEEGRAALTTITDSIQNLKDNHLHTMQETLDSIKTGQDTAAGQANQNTRDLVAAINQSKDAIVTAFLSSR